MQNTLSIGGKTITVFVNDEGWNIQVEGSDDTLRTRQSQPTTFALRGFCSQNNISSTLALESLVSQMGTALRFGRRSEDVLGIQHIC